MSLYSQEIAKQKRRRAFTARFLNTTVLLGIIHAFLFPVSLPVAAQGTDSSTTAPEQAAGPTAATLPGGLRLTVEERPDSPLVAIDFRVRVGSGKETAVTSGIAHVVEHLVFKGTATRPPGNLDLALENLGGEFSARTSRDATQFTAVVPAEKWRDALSLFAEMILAPAFRPADWDAERLVIRAEMAAAALEPERLGFSRLATVAYEPTSAYHFPIMGSLENVERFTVEDARRFWQKWYRPDNFTVTVVGNVRTADVSAFTAFLFRGDGAPIVKPGPAISTFVPLGRVTRAPEIPQQEQLSRDLVTLLMAFRVPAMDDTELLPTMEALAFALARGRKGRFTQQLVVRDGLALSATADLLPGRSGSLMLFTFVTRPRQVTRLETAIVQQLTRLREEPLTEQEADVAVAGVLNRQRYDGVTVEGRARWLAALEIAAPGLTPRRYGEQIGKVKAEALNQAVSRYLSPLSYAVAIVGPPPPLETEEAAGNRTSVLLSGPSVSRFRCECNQ